MLDCNILSIKSINNVSNYIVTVHLKPRIHDAVACTTSCMVYTQLLHLLKNC